MLTQCLRCRPPRAHPALTHTLHATPGAADGGAGASGGLPEDAFLDEDALPGGGGGYAAAYARLANAAPPERAVLADIGDPAQYAAGALAAFMQRAGSGA